ncbi:hypothetical protein NMG60_11014788 [Bertholletia excelsa]
MGCCVSTQQHRRSSFPRSNASKRSKTAAPPEEETVKEVLSETATQKPKTEEEVNKKGPGPGTGSEPEMLKILEEDDKDDGKTTPSVAPDVDVSLSESYSESASTVTERRDGGDGEVLQRVTRSPAKIRLPAASTGQGERTALRKSPARRPEPELYAARVRSLPDRARRAAASDGQRLRPRSSSPATRSANGSRGAARTGVGRSPSARKTGNSSCRIQVDPKKKTCKVAERTYKEPAPPPPTANESLENPLVSLECFIFL